VLYQNDDYGKDYLRGVREGLGARADALIVATATYETSDPTVDSQVITLHASGAGVLVHIETPKFAALAIRKVADIGWQPVQLLAFPAATITVMKAAGLAASTGVVTALSIGGDPTDPTRANDPAILAYRDFMKRHDPNGDPDDSFAFLGYSQATLVAEVLRRCGDELIEVVTNLKGVRMPSSLPGTSISYSPTDYDAYKQFQMYRFDGTRFVPFGGLVTK
jgi:branched-chain amino acid transport system substrate-binding protein